MYINRKFSSHDYIRQIREYQTGDSYRHIHWNLSSRTGDLLIKEFCGQVDREILVLLDTLPDDINNIERMSRNKWSIEKAPLYKMACKTIMERIEGELCAK